VILMDKRRRQILASGIDVHEGCAATSLLRGASRHRWKISCRSVTEQMSWMA
jgi:hypothetical protein